MPIPLRRQLFVNANVQGPFAWRGCLYCTLCLVLLIACHLGGRLLFERPVDFSPGALFLEYAPVLLAYLVLAPLLVFDMARLTNRWAGPLVRLRHAMRCAARGERVAPLDFRNDDFWREVGEEFEQLCLQLPAKREP